MNRGKAEKLIAEMKELLKDAPQEEDCTEEESEVYADMANLKQSLENGMPFYE